MRAGADLRLGALTFASGAYCLTHLCVIARYSEHPESKSSNRILVFPALVQSALAFRISL